jgi:hypothetical protein
MIETLKSWPVFISKNKDKGRKIERSVIAHIFVVAAFCCCDVKVNDL